MRSERAVLVSFGGDCATGAPLAGHTQPDHLKTWDSCSDWNQFGKAEHSVYGQVISWADYYCTPPLGKEYVKQ